MSPSQRFPTSSSVTLLMRIALHGQLRSLSSRLAEYDIPNSVWYFLRILWEADGLSQKELTRRAGVLQPNAVATLRTMEKMGLAHIERQRGDQRRTLIWLTPKGKTLEEQVLPKVGAEMEQLVLQNLDEQQRQVLIELLREICANTARIHQ